VAADLTDEDLAQYADLLRDVRDRLSEARRLLDGPGSDYDLEHAALHLRKVVELVVLGSLITNQAALESAGRAFRGADAGETRKMVAKVNPDYWPIPVVEFYTSAATSQLFLLGPGYLRKDKWGAAYGVTSEVLHARNPLRPPVDREACRGELKALTEKIHRLMLMHVVRPVDREQMLVAQMEQFETNEVVVELFRDKVVPLARDGPNT
jgi:hypothetical protein